MQHAPKFVREYTQCLRMNNLPRNGRGLGPCAPPQKKNEILLPKLRIIVDSV